jgi:hypothetical protein
VENVVRLRTYPSAYAIVQSSHSRALPSNLRTGDYAALFVLARSRHCHMPARGRSLGKRLSAGRVGESGIGEAAIALCAAHAECELSLG